MKRTFTTVMPDRVGAFMEASRIISGLGLNITRVSYNKAVDTHTLFIEVDGEASLMSEAEEKLAEIGYLNDNSGGKIMLLEFRLPDVPGSVLPVLELINSFSFNISYISSQENGTGYQYFRMGLFVGNPETLSDFIRKASVLCGVRIIDYDKTEKVLDNTIFYVTFANAIAERNRLSDEDKASLVVNSNLIMELLDKRSSPPYKTFDYIGRFAEQLADYKGAAFIPRITSYSIGELTVKLIEPPCGSNICILDKGEGTLFVDCGFACYREELTACLNAMSVNIGEAPDIMLTHADVDHCGLLDLFGKVYLSKKCYDNFAAENAGKDNLREQNPLHAPYVRISKLLSSYRPPKMDRLAVVGGSSDGQLSEIERIGTLTCDGLSFEVYEGSGGHIDGETVYVEREHRLVFTGDIFVNIKEFTKEQALFNSIAPYLMTSVDTQPELAARERKALMRLLGNGEWLIFGGHGAPKRVVETGD